MHLKGLPFPENNLHPTSLFSLSLEEGKRTETSVFVVSLDNY